MYLGINFCFLKLLCFMEYVESHVLSHFSHVQLCDPVGCSLSCSPVHGILQARILEWVSSPSSRDLLTQGWNSNLLHLLYWRWILSCRATEEACRKQSILITGNSVFLNLTLTRNILPPPNQCFQCSHGYSWTFSKNKMF